MNFKNIKQNEVKKLGKLIHRFPAPWKISALDEINGETVVMTYNNVTRRNSQIWLESGQVPLSPEAESAETLGQPKVFGNYVVTAGECGYLVYSENGAPPKHHFKLDWATTCCEFNGKLVVIDQRKDKRNYVRDCSTKKGDVLFQMPGNYIALDSCVYNGLLWAAVGWDQGLSCSNGKLYKLDMCSCVVNHRNQLLFSAKNSVYTLDGDKVVKLGELPCEKIMHMVSYDNSFLRIAGGNADTCWELDSLGNLTTIGTVTERTVKEIGGGCFGWRISRNFYARTRLGDGQQAGRSLDMGEVYEII